MMYSVICSAFVRKLLARVFTYSLAVTHIVVIGWDSVKDEVK